MMFLGGAALEGPRYIWWNFVSSRRERIEQAKEDWKTGKFAPVPGETEFIPLPDSYKFRQLGNQILGHRCANSALFGHAPPCTHFVTTVLKEVRPT
jgi:hypothetical protein